MRPLSDLERAAWQRLADAELAVREACEDLIRITNREHAHRSRHLRLVSPAPGSTSPNGTTRAAHEARNTS